MIKCFLGAAQSGTFQTGELTGFRGNRGCAHYITGVTEWPIFLAYKFRVGWLATEEG